MACLISIAAQAEIDAYKALVAWLKEAERVRQLFSDADLSLPRALEVLFQETKGKVRRKRLAK